MLVNNSVGTSPLYLSIQQIAHLPESVSALIEYYLFGLSFIFDEQHTHPIKGRMMRMIDEIDAAEEDLANEIVIGKVKDYGLESDEATMTLFYDLAYYSHCSLLYRPASIPVLPHEYTLNFLWENFNPQDRIHDGAQNIFKDGLDLAENAEVIKDPEALRLFEKGSFPQEAEALQEWEKIQGSFTYKLSKWADLHPRGRINLWYDSALVTQRAQQKTFEMIAAIAHSRDVPNLRLRDVRELPNVEGEIEHSLHPGTPVYFRVDLLKALIADYMLTSPRESAKYCVISDIDVQPMTAHQLFDQRTLNYLDSYGYVFHRKTGGRYENSFFIFNKEKTELQRIHNEILIQEVVRDITTLREYELDAQVTPDWIADRHHPKTDIKSLGSQNIFNRYAAFVKAMGEEGCGEHGPRKVINAPGSQFFAKVFDVSDFRSEEFRFIGDSNVPYTRGGRTATRKHYDDGFKQIVTLLNWKAEPLAL